MMSLLKPCGPITAAENGKQAIAAYLETAETKQPFYLPCLDVLMPEMDGCGAFLSTPIARGEILTKIRESGILDSEPDAGRSTNT